MDAFVIREEVGSTRKEKEKESALVSAASSSTTTSKKEAYILPAKKKKKTTNKDINRKHEKNDWDPEWKNIFPWLERRIVGGIPLLFCLWCEKYNPTAKNVFVTGCNTFRKDYLNHHLKINDHNNAIRNLGRRSPDQNDLFTGFSLQVDHDKLQIISRMRCVYLCQETFANISIPDIVELTEIHVKNLDELVYKQSPITLAPPHIGPRKEKTPNSEPLELFSNYASYTNPVSGASFLHAIATVIEVSSSAWSLLIDESNTITHDKNCAIINKHLVQNQPVLRFLGLIELEETIAVVIMQNLNNFLLAKMLNMTKLLHFGSDGDSTMIGIRSGVFTRLKKLNPFMSSCHCIAHRLALAGKDSATTVPYFMDYEVTIKDLYAYFGASHNRWRNLRIY
ncbi:5703_t:CDS:2 [Ambispora gerdemannii]|uniref:5703_t:CDS:1 n=1 Tax=Ambispora gerdemannii TaxID=144530 RepID=A0A9N9FRQ2_9GLOM|nr:5703_t:CDS:2 [Ambispora gerdemannii]